jgi:hypothetical protein
MPESISVILSDHATLYASLRPITPDSSGADLSFVRHLRRRLTHNLITMNRLPLYLKKVEIPGLLRHPCIGNPHSFSRNPQPTTHNPARDADLAFVRHFRSFRTNNRLTISSLSLPASAAPRQAIIMIAPEPCGNSPSHWRYASAL